MPESSDLKRAFAEDGPRRTHIGGQALIEGVMMRGRLSWAVAVREPDGNLYSEEHDLGGVAGRPKWFSWPLVRGCVALVDSLALGFKALEIAANHAFDDEEGEGGIAVGVDDTAVAERPEAVLAAATAQADDAACGLGVCRAEPSGEEVVSAGSQGEADERPFSWKHDFGRPDTMIEALGAQTSLEVVHEPAANDGRASCTDAFKVGGYAALVSDEVPAAPSVGASASDEPSDEFVADGPSDKEDAFSTGEMAVAMILGIVLGVALFIFLPAFLSNVLVGDYEANPFAWNIVDGILRVAVFVFYVWLIGRMKDIKRMFSYHGAEHKAIHCYEHGLELTPDNARSFPRLHVRCGTAFLIMVMIIAIVVYTVVPMDALLEAWGIHGAGAFVLLIVLRLVLLPLIAGVSYEITVKWAGSHPENPVVRVVLWPGMQMQRLTTNEPDDGMLECAIRAMQLVVEREERAARERGA